MINNHINYIELYAADLESIKEFYSKAFDWKFTDYGPDYTAFENSGIAGGFFRSDQPIAKGVLVILYHSDLESSMKVVIKAGGKIVKDIFSFPGGRRFHFLDPVGHEMAIWSDHSGPE